MTEIEPCRRCGAGIRTHVDRCPSCGAREPRGPEERWGWKPLVALAALVAAALLAWLLAAP